MKPFKFFQKEKKPMLPVLSRGVPESPLLAEWRRAADLSTNIGSRYHREIDILLNNCWRGL